MFNILENLHYLLLFLFLLIILITYFTISYKRLRVIETNRLNLICVEIELEKKTAQNLKSSPKEILVLNKRTQNKLQKIKVDILNIDFTLSEIFN